MAMPGKKHARAVAKIKKRQRSRNKRTKKEKTPKPLILKPARSKRGVKSTKKK